MSVTVKALALSFLERYTSLVLGVISTMVLSRLLTPQETGLFSIGAALTVLVAQFRDFGIATYLLQEKDLTDQKFRTALGVSIVASGSVMLLIIAGSFWAGEFYQNVGVTHVMLVTALTFIFIPFNALVLVWQRRQMNFSALYRMTLAGSVAHAVTGVTLAWFGAGYMSLAWASLANNMMNTVVAWRYRPRQFSYVPSLRSWQRIAAFGVYTSVATMFQEITPRTADLFLGRTAGLAAVGQFSRANGLVGFINQSLIAAVLPVAVSVFALKRRTGEDLAEAYRSGIEMLTVVAWPAFAFVGLMTFPMVRILFGDQWDVSIEPARYIALSAIVACLTVLHPTVFDATGEVRRRMNVQVMTTPLKVLVLLAGAMQGLTMLAVGTIVCALIEFIPSQIMVNRIVGMHFTDLAAVTWRSLVGTLASAVVPVLVLLYDPPHAGVLWRPLIIAAIGAGLLWIATVVTLGHPIIGEIRRALGHVRRFARVI